MFLENQRGGGPQLHSWLHPDQHHQQRIQNQEARSDCRLLFSIILLNICVDGLGLKWFVDSSEIIQKLLK